MKTTTRPTSSEGRGARTVSWYHPGLRAPHSERLHDWGTCANERIPAWPGNGGNRRQLLSSGGVRDAARRSCTHRVGAVSQQHGSLYHDGSTGGPRHRHLRLCIPFCHAHPRQGNCILARLAWRGLFSFDSGATRWSHRTNELRHATRSFMRRHQRVPPQGLCIRILRACNLEIALASRDAKTAIGR